MFRSAARLFAALTVGSNLVAVCSYHLRGVLAPRMISDDTQFVIYRDQWALDTKTTTSPAAPHFVVYSDQWVSGENGPPPPSVITGFNVFILAFLLASGPADQAEEWVQIGDSARSSIKTQYNNAGVKLVVSAFGSTESPTTSGEDPIKLAETMAAWVKRYNLDGIDVDYEDFNVVSSGKAVDWLVTFTTVLRQNLPQAQYIITHAPIAPWFPSATGSPYLSVDSKVGSIIDWYNVQFYSQGSEYTTCTGLVANSGTPFANSSIFEVNAAGVGLDKIVTGKPATASDASGFIDPSTLATCVQQAKNKGWSAGVMVWQYPNAAASWIKTVRSLSWPI